MNKIITIFIPTFRRPRSLYLCLKRLLLRTDFPLKQIQFLVVDGDNDDNIKKKNIETLEKLGINDYKYQTTNDFRASTDFNRAIDSIETPFMFRLEDDQYCIATNKNWLKDAIKLLTIHDRITLITGEAFEHYGGPKIYDYHLFHKNVTFEYVDTLQSDASKAFLLPKNREDLWPLWKVPFSHGPNIYRTSIWNIIGRYPNQKNQNECENWLQTQFVNNNNFEKRHEARLFHFMKYKAHLEEPFTLHGVQLFHGPEMIHGNGFPTGISHGMHGKGDIPEYIDLDSDYILGKQTWLHMYIKSGKLEFSPYIDKTGKLITRDEFDKYGNPIWQKH